MNFNINLSRRVLKKIIKYLILFIIGCILIYFSNTLIVNAYTISNNSIYVCDSSDNVITGRYNYILDGSSYTGYFGTTYQGVMTSFSARFNAQIDQGNSYTLELNSYTGDFRNITANSIQVLGGIGTHCSNNLSAYTITSVSSTYYKIIINFIANSTNNYSQLVIYNDEGSAITGVTNFKVDSMTLVDNGNEGTNTIIDNQNQNKQDIIDSQNQNTNTIIDNQNQNKQDIIDNQTDLLGSECPNLINLTKVSLSRSGPRNYVYTLPQTLSAGTYTLTYDYFSNNSPTTNVELYLSSNPNEFISLTLTTDERITFTIDNSFNTMNFLILSSSPTGSTVTLSNLMLVKGSSSSNFCEYGSFYSKLDDTNDKLNDLNENQQATNDKLDDLQDSITDSSSPDTSGLSDAAGWLPPGPVDSLVNLPINLLNSLLGNMGTTCTNIDLTLPFINKDFTIPCPTDLLSRLGNTFLTFWEGFGLIAGCWCLYKYFIALYKWVESALTLDEKEQLGKWGGV